MSRFIPLLFALLCVPLAYGQTATVEGTVRDVAGGALPGVNVFWMARHVVQPQTPMGATASKGLNPVRTRL